MPDMTPRPDASRAHRSASATPKARRTGTSRRGAPADDWFFRHIVSSMRNGVLAIHRDGTLALMNDEAYRIFALTRQLIR